MATVEPRHRAEGSDTGAILSVRDLNVQFPTDDGVVTAVNGVSFDVGANEILGIVGESGSGKTVTSLAICGLLPDSATISGQVAYRGQNVLRLSETHKRELRGARIAMVFQDALAALNPVFTVGHQIAEAISTHHKLPRAEVRRRAVELLDVVGIPNPGSRVDQYPHEYSGGMRQRAMIAMAIANDPDVLIADEPTTALDVTIQAQILEVLQCVQDRTSSAIILITHDLGVVAGVADRVMVMYAGRQVELGPVADIFYRSRHPYTLGLLASLPRVDASRPRDLRLYRIRGQPPSLIRVPSGCAFQPRCDFADRDRCTTEVPALRPVGGHFAACHFAERLAALNPDAVRSRSHTT